MSIAVDVVEPVERITLNAIDLTIESCAVGGAPATWTLEPATERLIVVPAQSVDVGQTTIDIKFAGTLNDKLRGFYRSRFVDDDGDEHVIATTQMQSTDCRRAFPCWDEPEFKAVFAITLVIDPALTAVSNSPEVARTERPDGKVAVRFGDTMEMSSYLVAFVVGPLEATAAVDVDGIALRVYHVPGKSHLTDFALDIGAFALRWFQDYYGIPYPGDKVDLLALPDFAAGAMENFGCITFRESLLLVDPATSTHTEQQRVADVVAHELAHMWFGDLVTMRWWNGIWLNEAFATFMEIAACEAFRPAWERWTTFGLERSMAFEVDSLESTRSIEFEVRSPADADGMFDVLTYQKGAAVLRMLEQYLGAEAFRAGVSNYLGKHAYGNTETSDLWDAIEETTGQPARSLMDSWIWQPGYPLVSATARRGRPRRHPAALRLRRNGGFDDVARPGDRPQRRDHRQDSPRSGDGPRAARRRRRRRSSSTPAATASTASPTRRSCGRACPEQRSTTSTRLERYNLVDDAWAAVTAGRLTGPEFLSFAEGFADEREFAVWQALLIGLRGLGRFLGDDDYPRFQARVADLLRPVVADLGDPVVGESDLTGKLRGLLTGALAVLGDDQATIERCRQLYQASVATPRSAHPELVAAATSVVAATGDADDFDRLFDAYKNANTPQEQLRHLFALAEFDDESLIERTCELCFSDDVKSQNAPFLLRLCIANRRHGAAAWTFVRQRWDEANVRFPNNSIGRMVDSVQLLTEPSVVADVQAFFAEHPIPQAAKSLDQILERQRINAAARVREQDRLAAIL